MYTVMHISDLHRSRDEPVDNDSLMAALLADCDRYRGETPRVPFPDSIVVSGDLIQGARVGLENWQGSMKDQYEVARGFLTTLCDRFLDGNKSQIVLIPGNHDVCWNTALSAMELVPNDKHPADIYAALAEPGSAFRWSWREKALYRIQDMKLYAQRMDYYWDFVEEFYRDVDLPIPIDRARGFQLFELCDRRIVVAAFDSIVGNDCFGYSGAIPRGAVGQCAMALRDAKRSYDLRMAVWHHSIQGPPIRSDYMDASQVQEMIGHGFQLGLHGHQHIAAAQTQLIHLDEGRSMAVVSAGSLCAGAKELPRGIDRQYNLIVIEDDFLNGRVHVREMGEGSQFSRKRNGAFLEGYVDIRWQPKTNTMGHEIDAQAENARRAVLKAETALRENRPKDAIGALDQADTDTLGYARKLMVDALIAVSDWSRLATLLREPGTVEEDVLLISALTEIGDVDAAQSRLDAAEKVDVGTRSGLQSKIDIGKLMGPK